MSARKRATALTPWFPPEVKPVHVGVYKVRNIDGAACGYSLWDGRVWRPAWPTPALAARALGAGYWQLRSWRGLTRPKAKSRAAA